MQYVMNTSILKSVDPFTQFVLLQLFTTINYFIRNGTCVKRDTQNFARG